MNLSFKNILLTCCCFFVFAYTNGQVRFYTAVSSNEISKDGYFIYRIIIENASGNQNIDPPSLKDFNILDGPTPLTGFIPGNGRATPYIMLQYELGPRRTGKFVIGRATATIAGKVYKSNTATLLVKNTASPNAFSTADPFMHRRPLSDFDDYIFHKGDSLADKINKNMEFRVEVDKQTCYVGEPVVASYKLYTRLKSESRLTKNPSFTGFSVIYMLQRDIDYTAKGKLNGKEYNILPIRKAQLYSLQPGLINLESAEIETNVQFIKEDYAKQMAAAGKVYDDFPGSLFPPGAVVNQVIALKSGPLDITVKPLPEKGRPAAFKGAVGSFSIHAALQKPLLSTDEPGKLSVTISGSGNMQLLTAPDIIWPAGIESFDPKISDNLVKETVPVSGNEKFEYSFAANDTGHFTLPSISFSYFDPVTVTYKTIVTEPIAFQVTKGNGSSADLPKLAIEKQRPSFINRIFYHRWWIIIFIAVVMLMGLITWLLMEKQAVAVKQPVLTINEEDDGVNLMIEASAINQKNVFPETEKCLDTDDCFGFYNVLNTELKNYLANKFSADPNAINSSSIISVMDKKGISNDIVLKLQRLMGAIEWQLYTPFERNEKMNELYQEAHETVQMINAYDIRHL